jgi:hypothetical protein
MPDESKIVGPFLTAHGIHERRKAVLYIRVAFTAAAAFVPEFT